MALRNASDRDLQWQESQEAAAFTEQENFEAQLAQNARAGNPARAWAGTRNANGFTYTNLEARYVFEQPGSPYVYGEHVVGDTRTGYVQLRMSAQPTPPGIVYRPKQLEEPQPQ
jgi:hypothetical protein